MLVFAHLGLTLAAARLINTNNPALAFLVLGSLLPDLIDKPLGWMIYGSPGMGRIYAHTLLFLVVLTFAAAASLNIKAASLAGGVLAHLCLDSMWKSPIILLWPLLGDFPIHQLIGPLGYLEKLFLALASPATSIPELLGLAYLVYYLWRVEPGTITYARDQVKYQLNALRGP